MKTDRLQNALGAVRDDYILDAHSEKKTNSGAWRRWGTLAACLCLAAVCAFGVPKLLRRDTVPEPVETAAPDNAQITPTKPYAPDISQMTPAEPGTDPVPAPGPDDQPIQIPGPTADPANPGTNPVEPTPLYDWPVIYNEVDSMPDAETHYVSLASRPLTEAELDALLPIRGGDWLELERAEANFNGFMDENRCLNEGAKLDSVELDFVDPNRGCCVRIGMWPAGRTSLFSWASQFDPEEYKTTNFGDDQDRLFLTLFECEDTVWTYLTCGDVSYYVSADKAFRDGIGDNFYYVVLGLLRSTNNSPDLSIIVPNP